MLFKEKRELVWDKKIFSDKIFFHQYYKKFRFKGRFFKERHLFIQFIFHPSIHKIRKTCESNKKSFFPVSNRRTTTTGFLSDDGSKATLVGDIPADMLKVALDIHLSLITKVINLLFENGCFPDDLKLAEISPTFKRKQWSR